VAVAAERHVATGDARVSAAAQVVGRRASTAVERADERLHGRTRRLRLAVERNVAHHQTRLDVSSAALGRAPRLLQRHTQTLATADARLRLLDPATTLERGWSITRTADGRTVRSAADIATGDALITTFAHGTATSRVEDITT
jgi:exodeoxyribonuclease VII large subunit